MFSNKCFNFFCINVHIISPTWRLLQKHSLVFFSWLEFDTPSTPIIKFSFLLNVQLLAHQASIDLSSLILFLSWKFSGLLNMWAAILFKLNSAFSLRLVFLCFGCYNLFLPVFFTSWTLSLSSSLIVIFCALVFLVHFQNINLFSSFPLTFIFFVVWPWPDTHSLVHPIVTLSSLQCLPLNLLLAFLGPQNPPWLILLCLCKFLLHLMILWYLLGLLAVLFFHERLCVSSA